MRRRGLSDVYRHQLASGKEERLVAGEALKSNGAPCTSVSPPGRSDRRHLLVRRADDAHLGRPDGSALLHLRRRHEEPCGHSPSRRCDTWRCRRTASVSATCGTTISTLPSSSDLTPRAITRDGGPEHLQRHPITAATEFGGDTAWFWSPDGKRIAFWRSDVTDVKTFPIVDELGKYSVVHELKYPNTAERHAVTRIGVHDLARGATAWMDIGDNPDDYIPRLNWTWRLEQAAAAAADSQPPHARPAAGRCRIGQEPVDLSRDGSHLDRHHQRPDPLLRRPSVRVDFGAERLSVMPICTTSTARSARSRAGIGKSPPLPGSMKPGGWLYFYGKKDSRVDQHVYRVRLDGTGLQKLSTSPGWYDWQVSADGRYAIESRSDIHAPPRVTLKRTRRSGGAHPRSERACGARALSSCRKPSS